MSEEPKAEVFFGDEDLVGRFAAQCVEPCLDAELPHLKRVVSTVGLYREISEGSYAAIALQDGEAVALIVALHSYHFKICQSGHLHWLSDKTEVLHRRMLDALDATQLSSVGPGMDVRNIMNRALRWFKKSNCIDEDDYQERLAIQDARYLTVSSDWMTLLDREIGRIYFGAK